VAAQSGGSHLRFAVKDCELIAAESGQTILVAGCNYLHLENLMASTPGDTFNLTADNAVLSNVSASSIIATNIGLPIFNNVATNGGVIHAWGRQDSAVMTLTGCSGSPTSTCYFYQQGAEVTMIMADLQGASVTNTCTLTGLPVRYQPRAANFMPIIMEDNGVDHAEMAVIVPGSGTMIFYRSGNPTGFASSGQKGPRRNMLKWRLDI
jgi:hypothetical protein